MGTRADRRPLRHPLPEPACIWCSRTSTRPRCRRWRRWPTSWPRPWRRRRRWRPRRTAERRSKEPTSFWCVSPPEGSAPWRSTSRAGGARDHPDRGGQRRPGRDQPGPAQHPRARGHRARHGRDLSRRLAFQHHQPHDHAYPFRMPGDQYQDRRPLSRGGQLHHGSGHCAPQALGVGTTLGRRGEPLPGADRTRGGWRGWLRHRPRSGRRGGVD